MVIPADNLVRACEVLSVHDGDTVRVRLAHGFSGVESRVLLRLVGINARELAEPGGREARDHLAELLPPGTGYAVSGIRPDKYSSRIDGVLWSPLLGDVVSVADRMVLDGHAAPWDGTGPRPVPPWPVPADLRRGERLVAADLWNVNWERPSAGVQLLPVPASIPSTAYAPREDFSAFYDPDDQ